MSSKKRLGSVEMTGNQCKKQKPNKYDCYKDDCCKQATCNCDFKKQELKATELDSDCFLVNSLVGTKTVQKVAEISLPLTLFEGVSTTNILSINVVPNLSAITQNVTVIKDKVVNIGIVPADISITTIGGDVVGIVGGVANIPFQAHTDFPGACPEDMVEESPLEIEGIFSQEGISLVATTGEALITGILVKIILRTTITVTRPVIKDAEGKFCDVNPNRCKAEDGPPSFTFLSNNE
ncbi:hypothetical protein [Virgibacillus sp.]|uniref:hypothetical protein n=1 Tax=Virgibacillus sp. TaxID=1872700 RepID=UPI0017F4F251|nr:hypothetical protein [Virgibacillus sp.]NWO12733.1 hypothetical protein [Virgibacillus sp.]